MSKYNVKLKISTSSSSFPVNMEVDASSFGEARKKALKYAQNDHSDYLKAEILSIEPQ